MNICPNCGKQISPYERTCPHCGHPLQQPYYDNQYGNQQGAPYGQNPYGPQQPPQRNNNTIIIVVLAVVILALLAFLAFALKNKKDNSPSTSQSVPSPVIDTLKVLDTVKVVDTSYVKIKEVEKVKVPESPPEPPEHIPSQLNGYYITSGGGYGAYLRKRPTTSSTKLTTYRDGTYFEGAYSSRDPEWIMVVKNGHIVGYIHEENVTPSEDYYDDGC